MHNMASIHACSIILLGTLHHWNFEFKTFRYTYPKHLAMYQPDLPPTHTTNPSSQMNLPKPHPPPKPTMPPIANCAVHPLPIRPKAHHIPPRPVLPNHRPTLQRRLTRVLHEVRPSPAHRLGQFSLAWILGRDRHVVGGEGDGDLGRVVRALVRDRPCGRLCARVGEGGVEEVAVCWFGVG